jgi:hypothetical protein
VKIEVQLVSPNMNVKERNVNIDKCLFIVWSFTVAGNGQRYVFVADYGARHCQAVIKFEANHSR